MIMSPVYIICVCLFVGNSIEDVLSQGNGQVEDGGHPFDPNKLMHQFMQMRTDQNAFGSYNPMDVKEAAKAYFQKTNPQGAAPQAANFIAALSGFDPNGQSMFAGHQSELWKFSSNYNPNENVHKYVSESTDVGSLGRINTPDAGLNQGSTSGESHPNNHFNANALNSNLMTAIDKHKFRPGEGSSSTFSSPTSNINMQGPTTNQMSGTPNMEAGFNPNHLNHELFQNLGYNPEAINLETVLPHTNPMTQSVGGAIHGKISQDGGATTHNQGTAAQSSGNTLNQDGGVGTQTEVQNSHAVTNEVQNGGTHNSENVMTEIQNGGTSTQNGGNIMTGIQNSGTSTQNGGNIMTGLQNGGTSTQNGGNSMTGLQNGGTSTQNGGNIMTGLQNGGTSTQNGGNIMTGLQNGGTSTQNGGNIMTGLQNGGTSTQNGGNIMTGTGGSTIQNGGINTQNGGTGTGNGGLQIGGTTQTGGTVTQIGGAINQNGGTGTQSGGTSTHNGGTMTHNGGTMTQNGNTAPGNGGNAGQSTGSNTQSSNQPQYHIVLNSKGEHVLVQSTGTQGKFIVIKTISNEKLANYLIGKLASSSSNGSPIPKSLSAFTSAQNKEESALPMVEGSHFNLNTNGYHAVHENVPSQQVGAYATQKITVNGIGGLGGEQLSQIPGAYGSESRGEGSQSSHPTVQNGNIHQVNTNPFVQVNGIGTLGGPSSESQSQVPGLESGTNAQATGIGSLGGDDSGSNGEHAQFTGMVKPVGIGSLGDNSLKPTNVR